MDWKDRFIKIKTQTLLILIVIIMLSYIIMEIGVIKGRVSSVERNLSSRISTVESQISGITGNIERTLEEEASILAYSDFSIGEKEIKDGTFKLQVRILPKEYSSDTDVFIIMDGQEYALEYDGKEYTAEIQQELFDDYLLVESVKFVDGNITRSQGINYGINTKESFMPYMYASFAGSYSSGYKYADEITDYKRQGDIIVDMSYPSDFGGISSCNYYVYVDGEEVNKQTARIDYSGTNSLSAIVSEDNTYYVPFGKNIKFVIEVIDVNGLRYVWTMEEYHANDNGNFEAIYPETGGETVNVYNQENELLYSGYLNG